MESRIAVLHRSEIVRKGFVSVLNSIWRKEILQFAEATVFFECDFCAKCRMLIFIEASQSMILPKLHPDHWLVVVFDCENGEFNKSQEYKNVTLRSETEAIRKIVSDFISASPGNSVNENELTQREKEILSQVAMGYSNKEIAESLFISIHTVITHRKNITGKLGIKSISGLTVYAIINRLIDPDLIDPEKLI